MIASGPIVWGRHERADMAYSQTIDKAKVGDSGRWFGYKSISLDSTTHVVGTIIEVHEGRGYRTVKVETINDQGLKSTKWLYM